MNTMLMIHVPSPKLLEQILIKFGREMNIKKLSDKWNICIRPK